VGTNRFDLVTLTLVFYVPAFKDVSILCHAAVCPPKPFWGILMILGRKEDHIVEVYILKGEP
jgi:hypothetical protein